MQIGIRHALRFERAINGDISHLLIALGTAEKESLLELFLRVSAHVALFAYARDAFFASSLGLLPSLSNDV